MATPLPYDQAIGDEICERIAKGESLRQICAADRDDFIPSRTTVLKWLSENEPFAFQYARACELRADHYVDEIIEIADAPNATTNPETGEAELRDPARDRLRVDARKWVASKLAPKKYGERVAHVGGGEDDPPIRTEGKIDVSGLTEDQLRAIASIKLPTDA